MKLLDANVLICAVNADAREHKRAIDFLEDALSGREPVAFAWLALLAFLRIATRRGLFPKPLSTAKAFDFIDAWLSWPNVQVVEPGENHSAILRRLVEQSGTAGNLTSDAHLAALAIEHGAELVSFDRDFARFAGLRTLIPRAT